MNSIKENIIKAIEDGSLNEAKKLISVYLEEKEYDDEIASMESIIFIYEGNYGLAMSCIKNGLRYNIFNSDLYFTMGNIYELREEYNRAFLCYEKALGLCNDEENRKTINISINNLKEKYKVNVRNYSIVMLTYNNLEYTKKAINSIREHNSNDKFEIIIIDNNSSDGTIEWLKEQKDIKYILNSENKGFPAGCNQGIELSSKENDIFLLNNDTVIMPNSIFNLRMGLYSDEKVGATGAVSNSVSYYQQIEEQIKSLEDSTIYSYKNNITNEESYDDRIKLIGFAMFIKREVLEKVGPLDERFTPGNYEDDDLSLRIILQGYRLLLCKDSYIHHFGSVSFKKDGKAFNDLLKINSKKFKEKWGFYSEKSMKINKELINLIDVEPDKRINILQIGCGCGATLLELKNKFPLSNIVGIEIDDKTASISKCFFEVLNDDIEKKELSLKYGSFDFIILDSAIQEFYNPKEALIRMKKYLKADGYILATIPNVMHYSVLQGLLNGIWIDSVLVDGNERNIRQFTKHEIIELFNMAEFKDIQIGNIIGYVDDDINSFIEKLNKLSLVNSKEDFKTYKYLIKAKNSKSSYEKLMQKISFILRRIEFNIDIEETIKELLQLIYDNIIDEEIIINLVAKDIIDKVYVLNFISIKCFENNMFDIIIPLLKNAYELDNENLDTNYNLAFVLKFFGENELALKYLDKLKTDNNSIKDLKEDLRGRTNE